MLLSSPTPKTPAPEVPPTLWGRILTSTPVVMTVVATLLAGLSNSEMTRAQYDRSLAAQQQSKAGDQWSFFQAKRLRGMMQQSTLDGLELSSRTPFNSKTEVLQQTLGGQNTEISAAIDALKSGKLPGPASPVFSPPLQNALGLLSGQKPESEIEASLATITTEDLLQAVQQHKDAITQFDQSLEPTLHSIDALTKEVAGFTSPPDGTTVTPRQELTYLRLSYSIRRYEAEARLNQTLANLYELQVRRSNLSADHHYVRSQRFFFGMLAAQLSVILSTFAMAMKMRNALWIMAAVVGVFAILLAGYVYIYV